MDISDNIKVACEKAPKWEKNCFDCEQCNLCLETNDYTGMNFCKNTSTEIINKLNEKEDSK